MLDRAMGMSPVLDVGCGPGRHVLALAQRGVVAMGVDPAPSAVSIAARRGAPVLERSVFAPLPGMGRWRSALLLDGNIGIGGDPLSLLQRLRELLAAGGTVLAEVQAPGTPTRSVSVRLEVDGRPGPAFPWATVSVDATEGLGARAGFDLTDLWRAGARWFVSLQERTRLPRGGDRDPDTELRQLLDAGVGD